MDKNGDGAITLDEMNSREGEEAKKQERFKKMDTNADGKITQEEFVAQHEARQVKMTERQAKKCDGTKWQKPAQEAPKK